MDDELFAALDGVAGAVADRYAARVGWRMDRDDLKQQALLIGLDTLNDYRNIEMSLDQKRGLLWTAIMRQLSRYCWRNSAPVSETQDQLKTLKGVHGVSMSTPAGATMTVGDFLPERSPNPEQETSLKLARELARDRFFALNGGVRQEDGSYDFDDWVLASSMVLLDGMKPAEVARELMLPVSGVYSSTELAKKRFVRDRVARDVCDVIRSEGGSS